MSKIDVVLLPSLLAEGQLVGRCVVVFDVLRATTTMAAALSVGVGEIRLFGDLASAKSAAAAYDGPRLLVGEERCLPPPGFDMGNSPGAFTASHAGRTLFMCTTNGTRALLAGTQAAAVYAAALVNAAAAARAMAATGCDITLLCAGTNGQPALEDLLGAGAVIDRLLATGRMELESDVARMALAAWRGSRDDLPAVLRRTRGGRNIIAAGLEADLDFAARVDAIDVVGRLIAGASPAIVPANRAPAR